jgi:hypothetical protein
MRKSKIHDLKWLAAILVFVTWIATPALAQLQNPFQAAKDAYNKAKQQLQGQQQPAVTPGAPPANTPSQPLASNASGVPAQGAAAPWAPPSEAAATGKVAAPAGPLDTSKLPDVAGIHVGIPSDEVTGIIKKLHPNATFQPEIGYIRGSGIAVADKQQAGTWAQSSVTQALVDNINVDYTWTPNKPTAFLIKRSLPYPQPVVHQVLVDALRQKYGKEIQADGASASTTVVTDDNIAAMWWLFDEQGHPVPRGPVTGHEPYGCIYVQEGQAYNKVVMDYLNHSLPAASFCDSVILLYVRFEPGPVHSTTTYLVDLALLRRSAVATGDWARAGAQKQHQEEQQKANQAKPSF